GIAPDRVVAIHLAVDHQRFSPLPDDNDASLSERLQLPERFVYYPAILGQSKNHFRLLEAFALLADQRIELVLTGASAGRLGHILDRARQLGVSERVHYLGFALHLGCGRRSAPGSLPARRTAQRVAGNASA